MPNSVWDGDPKTCQGWELGMGSPGPACAGNCAPQIMLGLGIRDRDHKACQLWKLETTNPLRDGNWEWGSQRLLEMAIGDTEASQSCESCPKPFGAGNFG